ncbi:MAG: type IV pilus assembly protein PilM [Gemmatimonadota bacterium]|jgi:type IV pilus assembly protein PilM
MALFGLGRSKRTVGLDIGSGYVKLVVMDHGKGRPRIVKAAATPLVADAIVEGEVMDPTLVASTIRSLFETAGVKEKKVVTAVGGRDVIIKRIQMDRMKESDAREVIRWEAEQHVPFDMESVELDFQILDPMEEGLQMTVLLVAAKRDLVENKVALLLDAGLEPEVIDVDAFALHNAFELNYPEAMSGVVGFVNIGHETTNVNLLEQGVPVLNRDLAFGTRRLRESLQRERGLTAEAAEDVLEGRASDPELEEFISQRAEEVALGVERAAAFLQAGSTQAALSKIYVCGGGARVLRMTEALAERLQVPTEIANPVQRVDVDPGAFDLISIADMGPMLVLPVGLALRRAA